MHIEGDLGEFSDDTGEFTERFFGVGDDFGNHEGGKDAVTGGFAWQDDVAGLFPSEFNVLFIHSGFDVGIADWGDFDINALFLGPFEKTLVDHDGGDEGFEFEVIG